MAKTPGDAGDNRPAEFEMQILGAIWEHGPGTVRQVMERLTDGKDRAYTSILSVMQVMQKKGLLKVTDRDGLANVFDAAVSREKVVVPLLRSLVTKVFGGSRKAALQHLLHEDKIDPEELSELRELLDEFEARAKSRKKKS
ncbi:MAG: BlaI/MecI/CopY family transcriptional regulator [Planctomycetaceae bacterium]|nr:BlaI/MecI/CopY family transcriptional regulator [Planctomycetaceae bacterium]